ncbi:hypothetical protein CB0940_00475, partial [Cercospora beticola]
SLNRNKRERLAHLLHHWSSETALRCHIYSTLFFSAAVQSPIHTQLQLTDRNSDRLCSINSSKKNLTRPTHIMSGTSETAHLTKEDIKKEQARESKAHGGNVPADSLTAGLQSVVDSADKNKSEVISERQANLPLPDQPPVASDFNSSDQSTVNVGSGGLSGGGFSQGNDALREPATGGSAVREDGDVTGRNTLGQGVGRQAADGLGGLPADAVAQGSKNKAGLADTTGKDYGYPHKSDPANTN